MTFSITNDQNNDILHNNDQNNDIQHNNTQNNDTFIIITMKIMTISII
jgi:hypothetical protein